MTFDEYLEALFSDGRVRVPAPAEVPPGEVARARTVLEEFEARYRLELPGDPPRLDLDAATWAGLAAYRACQFLLFRDLDASSMSKQLGQDCPDVSIGDPATHYAIDLAFRFLPSLVESARSLAPEDPLVGRLMDWARLFPLASVGVPDVGPIDAGPVMSHPTLRRVYIDRIIKTKDIERMRDPYIHQELARVAGMHPELVPATSDEEGPGSASRHRESTKVGPP